MIVEGTTLIHRQLIKPRGGDWTWVGPEVHRDDAVWWAEGELTYVRERPIDEIAGETWQEVRARRNINKRWIRYEAERVRMGLPIKLPWGCSKQPERESIRLAEGRALPLDPVVEKRTELLPPDPDDKEVRDIRQKRLAREAKTDRGARNRLMLELLPLVTWQARKQRGLGVPLEDLIQEGMLGIAAAIEAYTPRRGASFATYAATWSHGRMRRAIANHGRTIRVPEYRVLEAGRVRKARERAVQELGRTPTDADVASALGVPVEDVRRLAVETTPVESVDVMVAEAESDDPPEFARYLLDPAGGPEKIVMAGVVPEAVRDALRTLRPRDRRVLRRRYWSEHSRREIAEELGITEKAVRYSEDRALETLRGDKNLEEVAKFVGD
jgi:RNA polymerase primary sigma factor